MPPPAQPKPITKPKLLLGEGRDEVNFFEALVAHLNLGDVQVEEYSGKNNLTNYLQELQVRPGVQGLVALGITRDADDSAALAFQSVGSTLTANRFVAPGAAGQVAPGQPRVGVFLLPDNQRDGMLEDLCLDAVQTDGAMPCVTEFFRCVAQQAQRQPNPLAKARVHA